jgi:enoyl-CoA hydratase/carnithine racemase
MDGTVFETIELSVEGPVARIQFRREQHLNAYSAAMIAELAEALLRAEREEEVKILVLRGSSAAFCAGADLDEVIELRDSDDPDAFHDRWIVPVHEIADQLERSRLVVIGAIEGFALAGGLELALACDLLLAAEDARLGDQHVNFDLIPGGGGSQRLVRAIGAQQAKRLLFTGRWVSGTEAARLGLVLAAVPAAELDGAVAELVGDLAGKGPNALRRIKELVNAGLRDGFEAGLALERAAIAQHITEPEARAGIQRFLDRRAAGARSRG